MSPETRLDAIDWPAVDAALDEDGVARLDALLEPHDCDAIAALYDEDGLFRSRIVMARHGFGRGEYKYFDYPLPEPVALLRRRLYPHAARTANRWAAMLGSEANWPDDHDELIATCHAGGQKRPTPLLLRYGEGDYNCLHQDIYGEIIFPLQLVLLLTPPEAFDGGELVLTEQRPRQQSRAEVVRLAQGEAALFAVSQRPRKGRHGYHRTTMRHGVSRVRAGRRQTLGIIFHDAR